MLSHLLKSPKASSFSLTGVSRNPESDAAKVIAAKGVTMVKGDFADKASLLAAFQGADIVFANTDFWAVKGIE